MEKHLNIFTITIAQKLVLNKYLGNTVGKSLSDVDHLSDGSRFNCLSDGGTSIGCKIILDNEDFEFPRNQIASDNFLRIGKEQHLQARSLDSVYRLLMEWDPDKLFTYRYITY